MKPFVLAILTLLPLLAQAEPLREGASFDLDGHKATITRLDDLPYVESQYTKLFKFDSFDNPKLKQLRQDYHLDEVVAPGKDEFSRQLLLLDWVNHRFKKFGKPSSNARGALDILAAIDQGNTFFCSHYGDVFVSAAASMGWVDRAMALRRPDNWGQGSTEHTSTEIWSNQYRKWIMLDPTFAMHIEKDGQPLNAWEIREDWFLNDAKNLTFILDKDNKHYKKSDMPVLRGRYAGFGDLVLDGGAINPYGFIGYIPNTNFMDAGPDYGKMFITKDKIVEGTKWHERKNPADPAHDPYFPINQSALRLTVDGGHLIVAIRTMTPNFKTFQSRSGNDKWDDCDSSIGWKLHTGLNKLEIKSVNQFGVDGPISTVEVRVDK